MLNRLGHTETSSRMSRYALQFRRACGMRAQTTKTLKRLEMHCQQSRTRTEKTVSIPRSVRTKMPLTPPNLEISFRCLRWAPAASPNHLRDGLGGRRVVNGHVVFILSVLKQRRQRSNLFVQLLVCISLCRLLHLGMG